MPDLFLDIETAPLFTKEEYFQTKEKIISEGTISKEELLRSIKHYEELKKSNQSK